MNLECCKIQTTVVQKINPLILNINEAFMIRSEVWQNLTTHSGPLSDTARVAIAVLSNIAVGGLTVCKFRLTIVFIVHVLIRGAIKIY